MNHTTPLRSAFQKGYFATCFAILFFAAQFFGLAKSADSDINSVLRQPLPPEELQLKQNARELVITGPTFAYRIGNESGVIEGVRVFRDRKPVVESGGPAEICIDDYRLSSPVISPKLAVVIAGKDKVVVEVKGSLRDPEKHGPEINYTVVHTFFNDGVVVSEVKLIPRGDLFVKRAISYQLTARGEFNNYLHKRRDEHGENAARGKLPESGAAISFSTLTSCLSVFSPTAALAVFTDGGATHRSQPNLETAVAKVISREANLTGVDLKQHIVNVAPGDKPYLLKAGEQFAFRVGISLAPNRLPHPRTHDLRMFIWIGDEKFPYPTDDEISNIAQWGFTVFQLHRVGTVGEPRPPVGEFERVLKKVHETGMLFVWEENADLLYARAPGGQELKAKGKWNLWEGFNYGGRYKATMDPYCDLIATCLASPNGLAEYRLANIERMMKRYAVDGIYLDDNLGYANCTLWKEHGHPQQVYDCLIELHEMNWRRRELLRQKCPHAVLISHNTKAFVLPIIADFDVQYYAEGYCFNSAEDYWENYRAWGENLNAQGMICPGDDEPGRCSTSMSFNFDLLTGGGQYSQMDWRLFPNKFNYAAGVSDSELAYTKTYNLAETYFGLSESKPFYFANSSNLFAATAPLTYASVYHNTNSERWLVAVANMDAKDLKTSLKFTAPDALGFSKKRNYSLFDIHERMAKTFRSDAINAAFADTSVHGQNMRLFSVREVPDRGAFHLWGGKINSEFWNARKATLTFEVQGPIGLRETVFIGTGQQGIRSVAVDGKPVPFFFDSARGAAHGEVTFASKPLKIEVTFQKSLQNELPEKSAATTEVFEINSR